VRIEELINYFEYDYPQPLGDVPFSVSSEVATAPWNKQHKIVQIGLQGKKFRSIMCRRRIWFF
jgi:Ca-activated chloride channel family protein